MWPELRMLVVFPLVVLLAASDIKNKPQIKSKAMVLEGSNMTLTCTETESQQGDSPAEYHWFRDSSLISNTETKFLTLSGVSRSDQGSYSCRYKDSSGNVSSMSEAIDITVIVPPVVSIKERPNSGVYSLSEGSDLILTCNVTNQAQPPVEKRDYSWTYTPRTTGKTVNITGNGKNGFLGLGEMIQTTDAESTLTIRGLTRSQSGTFTCQVSNTRTAWLDIPPGTASMEIHMHYLDRHVTLLLMKEHTVVGGENVTLTCHVESHPTATLTWLRQGRILYTVESNEDVLNFTATGCEDSGEYQCRAHNEAVNKTVSNKTQIVAECPPSLLPHDEILSSITGTVGDHVSLSVSALGEPSLLYTWSGPGLEPGQNSSSLTLHSLHTGHAGNYTVNVSNVHGSFIKTFIVMVREERAWAETSDGYLLPMVVVVACLLLALICVGVSCFVFRRRRRLKEWAPSNTEARVEEWAEPPVRVVARFPYYPSPERLEEGSPFLQQHRNHYAHHPVQARMQQEASSPLYPVVPSSSNGLLPIEGGTPESPCLGGEARSQLQEDQDATDSSDSIPEGSSTPPPRPCRPQHWVVH